MYRAYSALFIVCAGLLLMVAAQKQTYAQSIEEEIVVPSPEPVEAIVTPSGAMNCYKIKEGFWQGKWVTEHRVCQYQHDTGYAWVETYWTCYKYDSGGACMTWKSWSSGWDKELIVSRYNVIHRWVHIRRRSYIENYSCEY